SELTGGIHLHTIRYPEKHMLKTIKQKLAEAGILYEG
ncbi:3H domain-containing protein, partial [Enterococcus lactis]